MAIRRAFEALVGVLNERNIRYAIIGGIATIQHTRIRTTNDIDALVTVPQIAMPGLFETLGARGFTVDVIANVRELRDGGMTSIRFEDTIVDLLGPVLPVYMHVLNRAESREVFGMNARISSAEGLIVMKLIAMRPQDEADIRELLAVYAGELDLNFLRKELDTVMDSDNPRRAAFERWVIEAASGGER